MPVAIFGLDEALVTDHSHTATVRRAQRIPDERICCPSPSLPSATGISAVHLKLGTLSGVVKEALMSSYEMACYGTPLQGSRLAVEEVPVVVVCPGGLVSCPVTFCPIVLLRRVRNPHFRSRAR